MTFAARENKCTKSRQTNTSHCPTKTISKTDTHPLKHPIMNLIFFFMVFHMHLKFDNLLSWMTLAVKTMFQADQIRIQTFSV